jgi:PAS domain S-box-containing protein
MRIVRTPQGYALRVAAIYGGVSVVWIVVTGWLVELLPNPYAAQLETGKGLFFVLVTSLALYLTILQWSRRFITEAARASDAERTLSGVVDTVPVGVLIVDAQGMIGFLNPTAARMIGLGASDARGRALQDFCVPDEGGGLDVAQLLRSGTVVGLALHGSEGSEGAVIGRAALLDAARPDAGWVVALADITEAHAESQRFQSLTRGYRFVSEAIAASTRARDEHQLLQSICEVATRTGGYAGAFALEFDPMGHESTEVATAGLGAASRETLERLVAAETPEHPRLVAMIGDSEVAICNDLRTDAENPWSGPATIDGFGSSASFSAALPDSRRLSVTLFAQEPGYFDHDQYVLLRSLCADVAFALDKLYLERRRFAVEEALELSEAAYRRLFRASPQVMWVYDVETKRFLAVNDAAMAKYGYSEAEFLDMTIRDIRSDEDVARLDAHLKRSHEAFSDQGFWQHRDSNHREFPVHILTHSVEWEGRAAILVLAEEIAKIGA